MKIEELIEECCNETYEYAILNHYKEFRSKMISINSKNIKTIAVSCEKMYDGGIEKVVANLCCIWNEMGYRVILYTSEKANSQDYYYPEDIKRIVVPSDKNISRRLAVMANSFQEEEVDIYINNNWASKSLIWEVIMVKLLDIPIVLYVHGNYSHMYLYESQRHYRHQFYRPFQLCELVLCLDYESEVFYGLLGCRVKRIDNPVPIDLLKNATDYLPYDEMKGTHKVLWIGRLVDGKRILDAIAIINKVKERFPDVTLEVVGDGPDLRRAKQIVKKEKISEIVSFHGFQMNVDVFYRGCSLMLMTSEKEGFCFTLLESKAYGLPCVMYSLPYLPLTRNTQGILEAPIGDIESMARHIIDLFENREKYEKLSMQARDDYERYCSIDIKNIWRNIFDDKLERNMNVDFKYYCKVIENILDEEEKSFNVYVAKSKDIVIGKIILYLPRKLLNLILKFRSKTL